MNNDDVLSVAWGLTIILIFGFGLILLLLEKILKWDRRRRRK